MPSRQTKKGENPVGFEEIAQLFASIGNVQGFAEAFKVLARYACRLARSASDGVLIWFILKT